MKQPFDIITFDCYGTLIDWDSGIASAFIDAAARDGVTLRRDDVLAAYHAEEPAIERDYRRYRDVLREGAARVAQSLGWNASDTSFLPESLPSWTPFPDTNAALEALRSGGYQLGILSNTDDDLIAATLTHFTVPFDLVITAQQVESYKPSHGHWLAAQPRIGHLRWLHAAQSNFHDIVPTNALGIPNAWINRKRETALDGGTPTYEFEDMASFAAAFT